MSKGMNLEGAVIRVRNTTAARYEEKGGRRTRPDEKPLRTTTKASRGWQEGLKKGTERHRGRIYFYGRMEIQPARDEAVGWASAEQKSSLSGEREACRRPKETP